METFTASPFCATVMRDWSNKGWRTDLKETYGDIKIRQKIQTPSGIKAIPLDNVWQLLSGDGPFKILVTGVSLSAKTGSLWFLRIFRFA